MDAKNPPCPSIAVAGARATARRSWLARLYAERFPCSLDWAFSPDWTMGWRRCARCWEICKLGLGLHAAFPRASQNCPFVGARLRMTLDTALAARCPASTCPIPAPRLLFFMRPVLDINRRSGPHSTFLFYLFALLALRARFFFSVTDGILEGVKTGRAIHRPPFGVCWDGIPF